MIIRQSDLQSFTRCAQQKKLEDDYRAGTLQGVPHTLSRTAYGSVLHHAANVIETLLINGDDPAKALATGLATFRHYWDPEHIAELPGVTPVDIWQAQDTWSGMLRKGLAVLEIFFQRRVSDRGRVLALELPFNVPYELDGEIHTLHGTLDKLVLRKSGNVSYIGVEDFKSGKDYEKLRWNIQFTIYCFASTKREFWEPWGDQADELFHRFSLLARRGTWLSLKNGYKRSDAGWRGPLDYQRMDLGLRQYVRAVKADIYPLALNGAVCEYCPFREGACGGVPVPDETYGAPA